jgi:hypothetical protein
LAVGSWGGVKPFEKPSIFFADFARGQIGIHPCETQVPERTIRYKDLEQYAYFSRIKISRLIIYATYPRRFCKTRPAYFSDNNVSHRETPPDEFQPISEWRTTEVQPNNE